MSEKLHFSTGANPTEHFATTEDSESFTTPENIQNSETLAPSERFRVNPADYPILQGQYELDSHWGNNTRHYWNIDKTLSSYITNTANLISTLDGTSTEYDGHPELHKPDHVIYLDKSARPVSWLTNIFWSDFSDAPRPAHSYLNIDRQPWLRRSGTAVSPNGYVETPDGSQRRQTFRDFQTANIPPSDFARLRALYIQGGINSEDIDTIRQTPSTLDGKHILIIDEVKDSGSTLDIAQWLIHQAFPEAASVRGAYFWPNHHKTNQNGTESQMLSLPVWYDRTSSLGRGIGDVDPVHYETRHQLWNNNKTRAQNFGSIALSAAMNLDDEPGHLSRELMREFKLMHNDFINGKILVRAPRNYNPDRAADLIEAQDVRLAPSSDPSPDTYYNIAQAIDNRPPIV